MYQLSRLVVRKDGKEEKCNFGHAVSVYGNVSVSSPMTHYRNISSWFLIIGENSFGAFPLDK